MDRGLCFILILTLALGVQCRPYRSAEIEAVTCFQRVGGKVQVASIPEGITCVEPSDFTDAPSANVKKGRATLTGVTEVIQTVTLYRDGSAQTGCVPESRAFATKCSLVVDCIYYANTSSLVISYLPPEVRCIQRPDTYESIAVPFKGSVQFNITNGSFPASVELYRKKLSDSNIGQQFDCDDFINLPVTCKGKVGELPTQVNYTALPHADRPNNDTQNYSANVTCVYVLGNDTAPGQLVVSGASPAVGCARRTDNYDSLVLNTTTGSGVWPSDSLPYSIELYAISDEQGNCLNYLNSSTVTCTYENGTEGIPPNVSNHRHHDYNYPQNGTIQFRCIYVPSSNVLVLSQLPPLVRCVLAGSNYVPLPNLITSSTPGTLIYQFSQLGGSFDVNDPIIELYADGNCTEMYYLYDTLTQCVNGVYLLPGDMLPVPVIDNPLLSSDVPSPSALDSSISSIPTDSLSSEVVTETAIPTDSTTTM